MPCRATYRYPDGGANRAADGNTDSDSNPYTDASSDVGADSYSPARSDGNTNVCSYGHSGPGSYFDADCNADARSDGNANVCSYGHSGPGSYSDADCNADKCGRCIQRRHLEQVSYPLLSDERGERCDGNRSRLVQPERKLPERLYPQRYRHPGPDGQGCQLLGCGEQ